MTKLTTLFFLFFFISIVNAENYSILDGTRGNDNNKSYDVYIISVNGKQKFDTKRLRLKSGAYLLNLASAKTNKYGRSNTLSYGTYNLNLKPCIRYLLSAQHTSNSFRNDDWNLDIKEVKVNDCTPIIEEEPFNPLKDSRTNNFQAETYAIALSNFLLDTKDECPNLKSDQVINNWFNFNSEIIAGSDHNIKHLIAYKNMINPDEVIIQAFDLIQQLNHQATLKIRSNLSTKQPCIINYKNLKNLNDYWPYNEVYKSFPDKLEMNDLETKNWNEAINIYKLHIMKKNSERKTKN